MTKKKSSQKEIGFNYYELTLLKYLKEDFPELAEDISFIKARAELAAEAESKALRNGYNLQGAEEIAFQVMYEGLLFSPYATVRDILMENYEWDAVQVKALELTKKLTPVFDKYQINDEFGATPEFDELCSEIKTEIKRLLAIDGL